MFFLYTYTNGQGACISLNTYHPFMIMSIILIRGYSHSGKDFAGNILCTHYGYQRVAFADSLKQMVADLYPISIEMLHTQEGKRQICEHDPLKRTYRQILIDEAIRVRAIDDNCFAKACCQEIQQKRMERVVITDWRYPNELEVVQSYFPHRTILPLYVVRSSQQESPVCDRSEYQLQNRQHDYTLINNMDESLYQEIDTFMNSSTMRLHSDPI